MKNDYRIERTLYKFGMICLAGFIIWLLVRTVYLHTGGMPASSCIWSSRFDIYCPGCGGTRAIDTLLKGKILTALNYHPFVVYVAGLSAVFMGSWTIFYLSRERVKGIRFRNWFLYAGLIILILQWIIKNMLLWIWGIRLL